MNRRNCGEVLSMGLCALVVVRMPALKTAGAALEAARPAYIAPKYMVWTNREQRELSYRLKS